MRDFDSYFSDARLISALCQKRIASARLMRRNHFIHSISGTPNKEGDHLELNRLLPPRRIWRKFRPRKDSRKNAKADAPRELCYAMRHYALRELRRQQPRYAWVKRLRQFLSSVQETSLNWTDATHLTIEDVLAFPKKSPGNGEKYRIVATYSLRETLICGGYAAYLRDLIDPFLVETCLAFRSSKAPGEPPPCHHNAVDYISELNAATDGSTSLWCAEIDIQGFYDAVSHSVAMHETLRLLSYCNTEVDGRLLSFLRSFLRGYDFTTTAVPMAKKKLKGLGVDRPEFSNPEAALSHLNLSDPAGDRIGIPQGSAVSCILANVVLSGADIRVQAVLTSAGKKADGLYLRYCDDIVIIHRKKDVCTEACTAYTNALRRLLLPYHLPKSTLGYPGMKSAQIKNDDPRSWFWGAKSKLPYEWGGDSNLTSVPWLAFVGYQFRRDGAVRARKSSIEKEAQKQRKVGTDIVNNLRKASREARRRDQVHTIQRTHVIQYRTMMHLLSIGVGYPRSWETRPAPSAVSWASGFQGILPGESSAEGLRSLDRTRVSVIRFVGAKVSSMLKRGEIEAEQRKPKGPRRFRLGFAGRPFSYWKQFKPES